MKFVILESPFAGDLEKNREYALRCMGDSLMQDEAPFASHLLYTQVLDDTIPEQRLLGIEAGLAIGKYAEATVVYTDLGISEGMAYGIANAKKAGRKVIYRKLDEV